MSREAGEQEHVLTWSRRGIGITFRGDTVAFLVFVVRVSHDPLPPS